MAERQSRASELLARVRKFGAHDKAFDNRGSVELTVESQH